MSNERINIGEAYPNSAKRNCVSPKNVISVKEVKEVEIRLAQAHSAMTGLAIMWENKAISFPTKIKLFLSPVLSVLLYGWMFLCVFVMFRLSIISFVKATEVVSYQRLDTVIVSNTEDFSESLS